MARGCVGFGGVPTGSESVKPTQPYAGQKPGTSGLRKKTREFMQPSYLTNFVQSVFDCLPQEQIRGGTLLVGGDGRYYCEEAIKKICSVAAGNGVGCVWVAKNGLCMTPACSAILRLREGGEAFGGFILTASHNPGGIDEDFGIKYDTDNGAPAQENLMEQVYKKTQTIQEIKYVKLLDFDVDTPGVKVLIKDQFKVEVIDGTEDWLNLMKSCFYFPAIKALIQHPQFSMMYDCMHGVAGPSALRVFAHELGAPESSIINSTPLPDFGGGHPDPNLVYAKQLVSMMHVLDPENATDKTPIFGAAGDGDCDRNMIVGRGFFVTPSDSVAIISAYAERCIPYCMKGADGSGGLLGVARSMPTSTALDRVAKKLGKNVYETPTGWKFFTNLMDSGRISICGEESFGTGSIHVREKDGIWAVLCWLSILAYRNGFMENMPEVVKAMKTGGPMPEATKVPSDKQLITVKDIVEEFWKDYGRVIYMRYDFENKDSEQSNNMMNALKALANEPLDKLVKYIHDTVPSPLNNSLVIEKLDVFKYVDPVDGSVADNQGIRLYYNNGRIIWRLSGTGSSGATIRMYIEKEESDSSKFCQPPADGLKDVIAFALAFCKIKHYVGTDVPTVIT